MDWLSSQKESQKWFKGLAAVNQQAQTSPKRWVVTCDRESDIFEFFKAPRKANIDLLVRVFPTAPGGSGLSRTSLPVTDGGCPAR